MEIKIGDIIEAKLPYNNNRYLNNWAIIEVMFICDELVVGKVVRSETTMKGVIRAYERNLYVFNTNTDPLEPTNPLDDLVENICEMIDSSGVTLLSCTYALDGGDSATVKIRVGGKL